MMRWDGFAGTLVFGGLAAASLLVARLVPFGDGLLGLQLVLIALVYVLGLAGTAAGAARVLVPSTLLAAVVWLASEHAAQAALGAALLVSVGRSLLVYRARALRGLAVESLLLVGGLGVARALLGPGLESLALAVWGFFLVQSLYFWIPGRAAREGPAPGHDAFEQARSRLLRLLEDSELNGAS